MKRDRAAETVEAEEVPMPVEEPRETQDMGFADDYAARALADL